MKNKTRIIIILGVLIVGLVFVGLLVASGRSPERNEVRIELPDTFER